MTKSFMIVSVLIVQVVLSGQITNFHCYHNVCPAVAMVFINVAKAWGEGEGKSRASFVGKLATGTSAIATRID